MMECNKDEAQRAKEIAEKKFNSRDFAGAKKFALKAQNLFPELEGIIPMIASLDVYLASETRVNGERDWYEILSVHPSADEETIKKQYRKLALQLHPDKNKSVGAEGAFQLLSEAWSVLSDKNRKILHDQKRIVKVFQQKASQASKDQSAPNTANGFYNFTRNKSSTKIHSKNSGTSRSATISPKADTFWTSCHRCRMQYEYLRIYLNLNLLCPNCKEPFLAVETGVPSNGPSCSVSWSASQQREHGHSNNQQIVSVKNSHVSGKNSSSGMDSNAYQQGSGFDDYGNRNYNWNSFSRSANAPSVTPSQAANVVHQTYEKVRREREEVQAAARKEEALRRRQNLRSYSVSGNSAAGSAGNAAADQSKSGKRLRTSDVSSNDAVVQTEKTGQGVGRYGSSGSGFRYDVNRHLSAADIRSMLIEKVKADIRKKLDEWNLATMAKMAEKEKAKQKQRQKGNDKAQVPSVHADSTVKHNSDDLGKDFNKLPLKRNLVDDDNDDNDGDNRVSDSEKAVSVPLTIDVPDPDFHDFDKDRSEKSFKDEQIWASYDNEDGMPRFYAFVQKVISSKPFKVRMSYLTSKSNGEFGQLRWVCSGFTKTCGEFRIGRYQVNDTINIFSHRVSFEKGARGVIKILPRKGDTWAVYRNWSHDWNEHTADDIIYKYDMVEVLDDYSDERGVSVTPLVKVSGFKTVYCRHADLKEIWVIPREEMFRFSHQVPSYVLTGEEAPNAPRGCRELDPAATPPELLNAFSEAKGT